MTQNVDALAQYVRIIRSGWRWLTWGALLALLIITIALNIAPPLYISNATGFIRTPGDVSGVIDGGDSYAQGRARTYAALADNPALAAQVITTLDLPLEPGQLSARINAGNRPGTALISFDIAGRSPSEARQTASALLDQYAADIAELESVPGSIVPRAELIVVSPPSTPRRQVAWGLPIPAVLAGAAVIGLLIGALGCTLRALWATPQPLSSETVYVPGGVR
jgi:uncharacterized protein involved in exopolysaccharide biosynthesis